MNDKLYNELLEYCNYDLKEVENTIEYFMNRLKSEENYKGNDLNNLELALIDEIEMILDSNYERYETGIDLSDEDKLNIAQDIISYEDNIWEDLYLVTMDYINKKLKKRLDYLRSLDNITYLEPKSNEYQELCILNNWERGEF